MTAIEKLLVELLNIPSVSGDEKMIGNFLCTILADFTVQKQKVAKDRYNIIAHKGTPDTYIVVHMDTVPGDVPVKVTKDKIFGRGAIDNKGNIAGAIMAARKIDNIGLIFTVGEEVDCIGAKKMKTPHGNIIIMEPTQMKIARAQRGIIGWDIVASGKQIHSSLDFKKEQSAVYLLIKFLNFLYQKNWTAFNAVITEGGEVHNVVSPRAKAEILIRPKNKKEYNEIVRFAKKCKRKNIQIDIVIAIEPCESTLIAQGETVSYFSEMAFFENSILFGVGNIVNAHTIDEYVKRADLNKLEGALLALIESLRK